MRPPFRKAKPPTPRKLAAIKKPDAERELLRARKLVKQVIADLEFALKHMHHDTMSEALDTLRKVFR